jgi:hypothetical protein
VAISRVWRRQVDTWPPCQNVTELLFVFGQDNYISACSIMQLVSKCHLHIRKTLLSCLSVALQPLWTLAVFQFLNLYKVGRTPWTGDQPVSRPLPTHRKKTHTDIHVSNGIRTHAPSVREVGDGSCLRPRYHCDGTFCYEFWKYMHLQILFLAVLRNYLPESSALCFYTIW